MNRLTKYSALLLSAILILTNGCSSDSGPMSNIDKALKNRDFTNAIKFADEIYNDLTHRDYKDAIDIASAYYLIAHDRNDSRDVSLWLTKAINALDHAASFEGDDAEDYFESRLETDDGFKISDFKALINTELEYITAGGNLADDELNAKLNFSQPEAAK